MCVSVGGCGRRCVSVCKCGRMWEGVGVCVSVVGFGRMWESLGRCWRVLEGVGGFGRVWEGERVCRQSLLHVCSFILCVCVGGGEGVRTSQGCAGGGGWVYFKMSPSTCMPEGSHCMPEGSLPVVESSVNVQCTSKAL